MAGVNKCLKWFLVVINLVFMLVGLAVLGVGIYLSTSASLSHFSDVFAVIDLFRSTHAIAWILIGCGCFIALVVICALIGYCRESKCLVIVYLILLGIILLFNVAVIILTAKGPVATFIAKHLSDRLRQHYSNGTDRGNQQFTKAIDGLQTSEDCCGWTGLGNGNIFRETPWYWEQLNRTSNPHLFPDSCCSFGVVEYKDADTDTRRKYERCVRAVNDTVARHEKVMRSDDCYDKLTTANSVIAQAVFGAVISAIVLQVICIVCSVVLVIQISGASGYQTGRSV